jgi:hypothetical protein
VIARRASVAAPQSDRTAAEALADYTLRAFDRGTPLLFREIDPAARTARRSFCREYARRSTAVGAESITAKANAARPPAII